MKYADTGRRTLTAWLLAGFLGLSTAACNRLPPATMSAPIGTDVTGTDPVKELSLTDHNGKPRTLAEFRGKAVVMVFGYTHCPDLCPTTLADMARVMKLLGSDAAKVQVLFVTLDPKRDTPALLAQYVPSFDPSFLALRGDAVATAGAARAFGVDYQEHGAPDNYTLDHTAGSFVLDPHGKLRRFLHYGVEPEEIAGDLRKLLE